MNQLKNVSGKKKSLGALWTLCQILSFSHKERNHRLWRPLLSTDIGYLPTEIGKKKKIVYLHFIFVFILLKLELCVGSFCSYLSAIVFSKNTWDKILKHFLLAFRLKLVKIVIIFLYLFRYPSFNFTWKSLHQGIKNLVKFSTIVTCPLKRMLDPQHPSWMNVANRQILVG